MSCDRGDPGSVGADVQVVRMDYLRYESNILKGNGEMVSPADRVGYGSGRTAYNMVVPQEAPG